MKLFKPLNNNQGVSTILIVMAVGAVLATFILTLQLYVQSRARVVGRIRLAYKYTFVMEDAAKMVVLARIQHFQGCTGNTTDQDIVVAASAPAAGAEAGRIRVCLDNVTLSNRCINDEACICVVNGGIPETPAVCGGHAALDEKFYPPGWHKDSLVAFEGENKDPDLEIAFEKSIFESLIPNFDNRFVAFFDRMVNRKPTKSSLFMEEAVASANRGYVYALPGNNMYGGGNPDAVTLSGPQSPYPAATNNTPPGIAPTNDAYNFRDCGNNRCIDLRVCVRPAKEQSIGGGAEVCFIQKISRSFLWNYATNPCAASACAAAADSDKPTAAEKGAAGCADCPWHDRF